MFLRPRILALIKALTKLQVMEPHLQECVDVTCCTEVGQANKYVLEWGTETGKYRKGWLEYFLKWFHEWHNHTLLENSWVNINKGCATFKKYLFSAFWIWVINIMESVFINLTKPHLFPNTNKTVGIPFAIPPTKKNNHHYLSLVDFAVKTKKKID